MMRTARDEKVACFALKQTDERARLASWDRLKPKPPALKQDFCGYLSHQMFFAHNHEVAGASLNGRKTQPSNVLSAPSPNPLTALKTARPRYRTPAIPLVAHMVPFTSRKTISPLECADGSNTRSSLETPTESVAKLGKFPLE